MSEFKQGDRVRVTYTGWEGEGVITSRSTNYAEIKMETGGQAGARGGFRDGEFEPLQNYKAGDTVDVTIKGARVQGTLKNDGILSVTYGNGVVSYINTRVDGVSLTVVEPDYPAKTVVKDSQGMIFQRRLDGGWWRMGSGLGVPDDSPQRPLTVLTTADAR